MNCIYCQREIQYNFFNLYNSSFKYCMYCFTNLKIVNDYKAETMIVDGKEISYTVNILYEYNEYARDLLYNYKQKGDISLALLFKEILQNHFEDKMENYIFLPIISSQKSYEKRGFNPGEELLSCINNLSIKRGPQRLDNLKQGKLSIHDRKRAQHMYNKTFINATDIVVFDDVITSGTTIKNFLKNITNIGQLNIKVVVLFGSQNYLDLE